MPDLQRLRAALAPAYTAREVVDTSPLGTSVAAHAADGTPATVVVLAGDVTAMMRDPQGFVAHVERVARVRHPALVPLLGAGVSPTGEVYVASQRGEGGPAATSDATARARLSGATALPSADEVGAAGRRLTEALATLHAAGLVHGGISPDAVLWDADGAGVRLSHAGLAPALAAAGVDPVSAAGLVTDLAYMSPEQGRGEPLDARSDIYSLGATLFELLTGRPPFGGRTTSMVMASVLADEDVSMVTTHEQAPGHVVNAILRAIEKAPDDRWRSAPDFGAALAGSAVVASAAAARPLPRFGCLPGVVILLGCLGWLARQATRLV